MLKFLEVKKFSLILIFQLLLQQALRRFPKTNKTKTGKHHRLKSKINKYRAKTDITTNLCLKCKKAFNSEQRSITVSLFCLQRYAIWEKVVRKFFSLVGVLQSFNRIFELCVDFTIVTKQSHDAKNESSETKKSRNNRDFQISSCKPLLGI